MARRKPLLAGGTGSCPQCDPIHGVPALWSKPAYLLSSLQGPSEPGRAVPPLRLPLPVPGLSRVGITATLRGRDLPGKALTPTCSPRVLLHQGGKTRR